MAPIIKTIISGGVGGGSSGGAATLDYSQIVSTSKPTLRDDGNALVLGDRWYKSDEQTQWYWNGTYWVGDVIEYFFGFGPRTSTQITTTTFANFNLPVRRPFLLQNAKWRFGAVVGNHSTSDYWTFSFRDARGSGAGPSTQLLSYDSSGFVENPGVSINDHEVILTIDTFYNLTLTTVWDYVVFATGTPHGIVANSVTFTYRLVQL